VAATFKNPRRVVCALVCILLFQIWPRFAPGANKKSLKNPRRAQDGGAGLSAIQKAVASAVFARRQKAVCSPQ